MAERTSSALRQAAATWWRMLPIITPPFVVGLGLILLFGRAGVVNQLLEYAFGIAPTRWFYGWFGVLDRADLRVHADRLHDHARRGAGRRAQPRGGGADAARRPPNQTFLTVTLPLLSRAWPTRSWSASSRASPTSATRSSSAASSRCCRPRSSSPSSAPSTTRAAPRRSRWILTRLRARRCSRIQRARARPAELHHRRRARATPAWRCRCPTACAALVLRRRAALDGVHAAWCTCSPSPAASSRPGAATTRSTLQSLPSPRSSLRVGDAAVGDRAGPAPRGTRSSRRSSWRRISAPI